VREPRLSEQQFEEGCMPNWQDVCWDYGAADAAIDALNRAAGMIEGISGERARTAVSMLGEWRGVHRERLNELLRQVDREDATLAGDLRRAGQEIARLSQQAREEQARRERERAEWEAEQARESEDDSQQNASSAGGI
jgi:hypothetical protein